MTVLAAGRRIDALGLFLTGGASNKDPDASLGGVVSATRIRGMGHLVETPIPAVRVDNVFPGCGEGVGRLLVNPDGDLVFTPPGGVAGIPVTVPVGETYVVSGVDKDKAVLVTRESGLSYFGVDSPKMLFPMNGVLSHGNVSDAQRIAGVTTYRAIMFHCQGLFGVLNLRLWLPPVAASQAVYSIATEVPVAGAIQTVVDEETAPTAVVFVTPITEGSALTITLLSPGERLGLWIRRVFPPAGLVDPQEDFQLAMKYKGA